MMQNLFAFDMVQSGLVIAALFVAGEWLSNRLKAVVPSFLAAGMLFLALLWGGILPADLVERSGFQSLVSIGIMFVILNMGTTTNFKELASSWRVVLLAAVAYFFELAMVFLVIGGIFGRNIAVAAMPGGSPVAFMVQERARSLGYDDCIVLSVLLLAMQGLVGCPLVSLLVRREASRLYAAGMPVTLSAPLKSGTREERPESTYPAFFKLYIGAWIAQRLGSWTGISPYVICLLLGVVFVELGVYRKSQLNQTQASGFFFLAMMSVVLSGFAAATPQMLLRMLGPLVCVLALDALSLTLCSLVLGRFLGFSPWMSVALGFNIMIGFPPNMMISQEIIGYLTDDAEKRAWLMEQIGNRMVIAGFTSNTFLANIMAGLLVTLMV